MTFSLLAYDDTEHAWGGVAATGSLCVGGWVLRGDQSAGVSASQGRAPSTFWGEDVLGKQRDGQSAAQALSATVNCDPGREHRQLATVDCQGRAAAFTGNANGLYRGQIVSKSVVVCGNILAGPEVLEVMLDAFMQREETLERRMLAALSAAQSAGGDTRGLSSAALLRVSADRAPLTLRVDMSDAPIEALYRCFEATQDLSYAHWLETVPIADAPFRTDEQTFETKSHQWDVPTIPTSKPASG